VASSHLTIGSGDRHVMALHGWFGSARGWGSLPEYLDGSAFTYVFPDLRGYGGRETPVALATAMEEFLGRE
jgi:pimeloyl-ACP methyl ester carboxylesterase